MNIEPQELPAEALAMLVENPGSSLVAQLLQHVAHQEQQLATLRSELARVDGERKVLERREADWRESYEMSIRDNGKLVSRALQAEARVAELERLLRDAPGYEWDASCDAWLKKRDQALASAGAEKPDPICAGCMGTGESRPDETCRVCKGSGADPSPGASERRTLFVIETLAKGVVWIETGHRRGALDVAQEDLRANPPGQFPKRIVRVTEIRDVIAAGEKEGGSK